MNDDKERVAFEKWYSTTPSVLGVRNRFERDKHEPEEYYFIGTRKSFAAWMAAKSEVQPSDGALTNEGAEPVAWLASPLLGSARGKMFVCSGHDSELNPELFDGPFAVFREQPVQAPKVCTCPSGDGSLSWPCPVHPPEVKALVMPERKGMDLHYDSIMPPYSMGWNACLDRVKELNS